MENINVRLLDHENSSGHKNAMCCALLRSKTESRIDEKFAIQKNAEKQYGRDILKRVVVTVRFLQLQVWLFKVIPQILEVKGVGTKNPHKF